MDAVEKPGMIHEAYSAFHNYSVGNQLLAYWQCYARGIPMGPIGTYNAWQLLKRQVRKGEKAITLCQPVTIGKEVETAEGPDKVYRTVFVYRPSWFVLSQTDGEPYEAPVTPGFDLSQALKTLEITEEPFIHPDGNVQGYAIPTRKVIAINPVAALPLKTTLHELAHCLLHSGEALAADGLELPRDLKEVEAEGTAYVVSEVLQQPGTAYSRGYIQGRLKVSDIPNVNARRILSTAEKILSAGKVA